MNNHSLMTSSIFSNCFFLVRQTVELESVRGTLGMKWEYTQDVSNIIKINIKNIKCNPKDKLLNCN